MRKNPAYEGESLPISAQLRLEDNPAYEAENVVAERNPAYGQSTAPGKGEQKHVNDILISESAYEQVLYSSQHQEHEILMSKIHEYEFLDVKEPDLTATKGEEIMDTPSGCDVQLEQST